MKENLFEEKDGVRVIEHKAKFVKWYGTIEHAILLKCSPESPEWLRKAFKSGRLTIEGRVGDQCTLCINHEYGTVRISGKCYIGIDYETDEIFFETGV